MAPLFYHDRALVTVYPDISVRSHDFLNTHTSSHCIISAFGSNQLSFMVNQMWYFYLSIYSLIQLYSWFPLCALNAVNPPQHAWDVEIENRLDNSIFPAAEMILM